MRAAAAWGAGLALFAACAAPAAASPRDYRVTWCIEDVRAIPPRVARLPIPVGCELIDCCPGCPAPGPLDWKVRRFDPPLASVSVHFEGVSALPIKTSGDAQPLADGARVGPRGGVLHGLSGGRDVAVARLELELDPAALEQLQTAPADTGEDRGVIDVAIEQLLGPVVVNEFRWRAVLRPCKPRQPEPCDEIVQIDNRGGDRSVLQLDARRGGGCSQDEQYRSPDVTPLDNVLSPIPICGELAVYSDDDAMWIETMPAFTDGCGDSVTVQHSPVLPVPVSIWRMQKSFVRSPALDLAHADAVFDDENKAGLVFDARTPDLSSNALASTAALAWCPVLPAFRLAGLFDADRLNVYYSDFPATGQFCGTGSNAIFVGSFANLATLAHEFGHAFTLQHVTVGGQSAFGTENLMNGGGPPTRNHLSLGQAFRCNVDSGSALNANGWRTGPERPCGADCPPLDLDWTRP